MGHLPQRGLLPVPPLLASVSLFFFFFFFYQKAGLLVSEVSGFTRGGTHKASTCTENGSRMSRSLKCVV